ncbi:MAG: polyprenol phosphomannose-dependent alpha 1,6 mannosyltransferase MptB [Solirubrobacterales bacterium]
MEETPATPATAPARRRLVARLAALALIAVSLPLATPSIDPGFVPGGGFRGEGEGWANGVLGLFSDGFVSRPMVYLCLLWLAIAIWVVLLAYARDLGLRWVGWVAGILITLFVLAPPLLSLDLFSYISYARLGAEHGLNPYEYAPAAIPQDDAAARVVDYRDAVSVYGPVFTLGTYPLGLLGVPFALWSLKLLAGLSVAVIAWIVARLARLRGVAPAGAVAFVALNPIVLVQLVGGGHNDALTAAIAMAAIAASLAARPLTAGAGYVLAAATKISGAMYAPFAIVGTRGPGQRGRLIAGIAIAAVLVGAVSLAAFGSSVTEALSVAGGNHGQISRWSVPSVLSRGSGIDVDVVRTVAVVAFAIAVIWLLVAVARGFDWVRAAGWAAFGVLVASAYIVPWYLIWVLPVAAISRDRLLIGATILLTVFQAINGITGISL